MASVRIVTLLLVVGAALAATGSALAAGLPSGNYTLVDGPRAGQDVFVGSSGAASILDRMTKLTAVPADDDCDEPHLHGTIGGVDEPVGGCGWGRILVLTKATPAVRAIANAITEEERAVASINQQPPTKLHWELALYGQLGVEHTLDALDAAAKAGQIADGAAAKIRTRLAAAHRIDEDVKKRMQANPNAGPAIRSGLVHDLQNALSLKREALTMIEHAGLKVADDASAPTPCAQDTGSCTVTAFWDVNVPLRVKSALCEARVRGRRTDPRHPVFPGVIQVQRCDVTGRTRVVGGERKRVVHFSLTLTGSLAGADQPVKVTVYWPV